MMQLEGTLHVVTMKRSIPNVSNVMTLFSRTVLLPPPAAEHSGAPFTIQLPLNDDRKIGPLPPTFHAASADLLVEVKYTLTVNLTRRGLHKDERSVNRSAAYLIRLCLLHAG